MSEIKQTTDLNATTLAAGDTFRETFSVDDEESSGVASTAKPVAAAAATANSPNIPRRGKVHVGWIIWGTAGLLLIIGMSIGLATRNDGTETAARTNEIASTPDGMNPFDEPEEEETIRNSLEIMTSSSPTLPRSSAPSHTPTLSSTRPPTNAPVTSKPTEIPSASPSMKSSSFPSSSPSTQPTLEPSESPSIEPSLAPSKSPTPKPSSAPSKDPTTSSPTQKPVIINPFYMGENFVTNRNLGIEVSDGLSVRLIARTGQKVQYANGDSSSLRWHSKSDAAGIIPLNPDNPLEDGYVYVSNSEERGGDGGVYGLYFDKDGNIMDYKALLNGTSGNCGGGLTPWNTWVSCEEVRNGQCWQVDPITGMAEETKLGANDGGRYESVAVDDRFPNLPVFFTTEDKEDGALRRFVASGNTWDALHSDGETTFLNILGDNKFEWTMSRNAGRLSAMEYFPNAEGIQVHEGKVYFMSKVTKTLIILDLENMTYETEGTGKKFYGEGSFGAQPDQNLFGPTRKYIYFTEDGGTSPGVYARYSDGTYFTMFQAIPEGMHSGDETIGIALSPDHRRFYAGIQSNGYIFEFTRDDGLPFE